MLSTSWLNMGQFTLNGKHRNLKTLLRNWVESVQGQDFCVTLVTKYHFVVSFLQTLKTNSTKDTINTPVVLMT